MVFGRIKAIYFFAALGVGLMYCYVIQGPPEIILKFPTPYNVTSTIYGDEKTGCYKYEAEQVSCPLKGVKSQPIG